jgi:hypothetical protein
MEEWFVDTTFLVARFNLGDAQREIGTPSRAS